jgi:hypothetical protein
MLKSNQQDLALRTTCGGGFARRLVQTDRTTLLAIGGAAYSHESYFPQTGTRPIVDNAEVLAGLKFSTFRFKTMNINSQTLLFPSLTVIDHLKTYFSEHLPSSNLIIVCAAGAHHRSSGVP